MRTFIPFAFPAFVAVVVASGTLTGLRVVSAADEAEPQFQDDFESLDPSWGEAKGCGVKDGRFFIELEPEAWQYVINQSNVFSEIDATVQVTISKTDKGNLENGAGGIIFWATDFGNFYSFIFDASGRFHVGRYTAGKRWLSSVDWQSSDAIKKGEGETNELRVVTKEHRATLYINGVEVSSFKGQHPDGGQTVGLIGESWTKEPTRFEFAHLLVK